MIRTQMLDPAVGAALSTLSAAERGLADPALAEPGGLGATRSMFGRGPRRAPS